MLIFVNIVLLFLFFSLIIKKPINGLLILPIVTYVLPENLNILRFGFISPGLLITSMTALSMINVSLKRKLALRFDVIMLIILIMYSINFLRAGIDGNYAYLKIFIQGPIPFMLFSLLVYNYNDAYKVIVYWTTSYGYFCLVYLFKIFYYSGISNLFFALTSFRNFENTAMGGQNPNVVTWVAILFLPLSLMILFKQKTIARYLFFGISTISTLLLIYFSQSRAGLVGLLLSLILFIIFHIKENGVKNSLFLISSSTISIITFSTLFIRYKNYFSHSGNITDDSFFQEVFYRTFSIFTSLEENISNITWFGNLNIYDKYYGTHSALFKSLIEFGIIYFFCQLFIMVYSILISSVLYKKIKNNEMNELIRCILISLMVAVPLTFYGNTLNTIEYLQVYLLYMGLLIFMFRIYKKYHYKLHFAGYAK